MSLIRAVYPQWASTDKIEIIVMGGTFTSRAPDYQDEFLKGAFSTLNGKDLPLEEALQVNGNAKHKCVALTIETRPTECTPWSVFQMRKQGATRVEIGVQCLDDEVLQIESKTISGRRCQSNKIAERSRFEGCISLDAWITRNESEKDLRDFKRLFAEEEFQPDMLKLYPTLLVKGSALARNPGDFVPYDTETAAKLIADLKEIVPPYVRIQKSRDILSLRLLLAL